MVTLKDVARHAAVSTSTASRILHGGKISVTDITRLRVLQAAEELNYRANSLARSLRTRTTRTLGFLLPNLQNPFYTQMVAGAEEAAQENDYSLLFMTAGGDHRRKACVELMTEDRVDGLIVGGAALGDEWVEPFRDRGTPIVLVNRRSSSHDVASVVLDDEAGSRVAIRHLLDAGHREIAYLSAPLRTSVGQRRFEGVRAELALEGITLRDLRTYECGFSGEGAAAAIDRFIWNQEPITAIAAGGIVSAMLALKALLQRGIKVPAQVSLIGFHDTPFAHYVSPGLTTVRMPLEELGRQAVLSVLSQVQGGLPESMVVSIPKPLLVVRESVSPIGGPV